MNRSKEVLLDLIEDYTADIEHNADLLRYRIYRISGERIKQAISEMEETAGKLMLACKDLKKEMER